MAQTTGWILLGAAALVAAVNFYLSFLRYPLHKLVGFGEYRWKSGVPLVGTVLLCAAVACLWREPQAWASGLLLSVLDTGGVPWFCAILAWARFFRRGCP